MVCYSMAVTKRLVRILCVAVLGLMLFDGLADAACQDSAAACATVCHSCACGPHIAPSRPSAVVAAPKPASHASYKPVLYVLLRSESFFRPPRLLA